MANLIANNNSYEYFKYVGIASSYSETFSNTDYFIIDIAYDGTNLLGCGFTMPAVDLGFWVHSGVTSSVTDFYSMGAQLWGIAFDGTNVLTCSNTTINIHDGVSTSVTSTIAQPNGNESFRGLTYDGTNIIASTESSVGDGLVYVYEGQTSVISSQFNIPDLSPPNRDSFLSLSMDGSNLVSLPAAQTGEGLRPYNQVNVHDGTTSSISSTTTIYDADNKFIYGIVFDELPSSALVCFMSESYMVSTLKKYLRDENTDKLSTTQLTNLVKKSVVTVSTQTLSYNTVSDVTVSSGSLTVTSPTDSIHVHSCVYSNEGLIKVEAEQLDHLITLESGAPRYYYHFGENIGFYPLADQDYTISVYGAKVTDNIDNLPCHAVRLLVFFLCLAEIRLREGYKNEHAMWMGKYYSELGHIKVDLYQYVRDSHIDLKIQDV